MLQQMPKQSSVWGCEDLARSTDLHRTTTDYAQVHVLLCVVDDDHFVSSCTDNSLERSHCGILKLWCVGSEHDMRPQVLGTCMHTQANASVRTDLCLLWSGSSMSTNVGLC